MLPDNKIIFDEALTNSPPVNKYLPGRVPGDRMLTRGSQVPDSPVRLVPKLLILIDALLVSPETEEACIPSNVCGQQHGTMLQLNL